MIIPNAKGDDSNKGETYYEFAPGYYISKTLKVYSTITKKHLTVHPVSLKVQYVLKNTKKAEKIHHIAGRVFLPKERGKKYVFFKDGNPNNRHVSNLIRHSDKNYFDRHEERTIKEEVLVDGILEIKEVKIRNAGERGLFASEYSKIYSAKSGGEMRALKISYKSTGTAFIRATPNINCNILVMRAFYPNEKEKDFILYKDGCIGNKHYTNYAWSDKNEIDIEFEGILPGFSKYKFSRNGTCKSYHYKEPRLLKPQMDDDGYFRYCLCNDDGKMYNIKRSRIVATIFLPNPDNLPEVDHDNKKRWDDRVDNLSWVTRIENTRNRDIEEISGKTFKPVLQFDLEGNFLNKFKNAKEARAFLFQNHGILVTDRIIQTCCRDNKKNEAKPVSCCGFLWHYLHEKVVYELKEGEKAVPFVGNFGNKKYDFPKYKLTNFGNILNKDGFLLTTHIKNGYTSLVLDNTNIKLHRAVAFFFVSGRTMDRKWVNHKDENKLNPHYLNLEWVTPTENVNYSKHKNEKPVDQFSTEDGHFIKRFKSGVEASRELDVSTRSVSKICLTEEGTASGFIWRFADLTTDHPDPIQIPDKNIHSRKVNKYDLNGKFIASYPSVTKAAESEGSSKTVVSSCCNRKTKRTKKGYIYRFAGLNNIPGVDLTEI